jgi:tetraacyldisaccharide 4'-kinase
LETDQYQIVTLSRGYKRKTSGLVLASEDDSAKTIGDEPAQFYYKYGKEVGVAVCEDRLFAIPHILDSKPDTNLILLDDAYQHRRIRPACNILLSDYNRPFYGDWLLPSGNLRELRKNARRADIVIITKCPSTLSEDNFKSIESSVRQYSGNKVPVYFMNIHYNDPEPAFNKKNEISSSIILVTGIAHSKPIVDFMRHKYQLIKHFNFADHHYYFRSDIKKIIDCYRKNNSKEVSIIFTEKDIMRLLGTGLQDNLIDYPVFFQPITYKFVQNGSGFDEFIQKVLVNTKD